MITSLGGVGERSKNNHEKALARRFHQVCMLACISGHFLREQHKLRAIRHSKINGDIKMYKGIDTGNSVSVLFFVVFFKF